MIFSTVPLWNGRSSLQRTSPVQRLELTIRKHPRTAAAEVRVVHWIKMNLCLLEGTSPLSGNAVMKLSASHRLAERVSGECGHELGHARVRWLANADLLQIGICSGARLTIRLTDEELGTDGVSWRFVKPQQAVAFASWVSKQSEPLLFGADATTPVVDALDFSDTRTHWHTGRWILRGEPGDDLLFGPDKKHDLEDALRRWLDPHPEEMGRLRTSDPSGPLAITYRTGRRKNSPGTGMRYDSVWVSHHWVVRQRP